MSALFKRNEGENLIGLVALQSLVLAVMIAGLLTLLVPVLPGLVIIWIPSLVYYLVTGFDLTAIILFVFITILMIVGNLVDNVLMGGSARAKGASWLAIGAALVASLVGSFVWPPFGGLIGALLVLFAVEYFRLKDWRQALDSTTSMAMGCGWAVVARMGIGVVMIALWILGEFVIKR